LPENLKVPAAADKVFPHFIVHGLPAGVTGLLIASIFAAGMSTVSTSVNSVSTIVLVDYYKRYFNPSPSEGASMRILYIASAIFGVAGIAIAFALISVKSALDAWWMLASVFSGGMLGLFLLGYFVKKSRNVHAAIGVAAGVLVICWLSLSPIYFSEETWFRSPFHTHLTIVIGTTVILLVGFLLAWRAGSRPDSRSQKYSG
jgi:SSS family solute:Na+ symporter